MFAGLSYPQEVNPEEAAVTNQPLSRQGSFHQSTEKPETYFSMNAWRTYDEIYRMTDETASLSAHLQIAGPSFARDDSVIRKLLPGLRANRDMRRGNRRNPERPTMIAKVCEGRGKGELWLGPLPIFTRMKVITETDYSIQIYCFSMEPETVIVDEREAGRRIPGAFVFRCDVSNPVTRTSDFESLQEFVITSLRQGDNVYVHCVTGVRRAVIVAALLSAILMDIDLEAAMDIINQSLHVEFNMHTWRQWNTGHESMEERWIDEMHQKHRGTGDQRRNSEQFRTALAAWGFHSPWHLCQVLDAGSAVAQAISTSKDETIPASDASHNAVASQPPGQPTKDYGEHHGEELVQNHTTPPLMPDPATMPSSHQQSNFEQPMANSNPQEANPEDAKSPFQQAAIQAISAVKEMTCLSSGSLDADVNQVPKQPAGL